MLSILKPTLSFLKKAFLVVAVYFVVISLFFHFIGKDKVALTSSRIDSIKQNRTAIYKVINNKELSKTKEGKFNISLYRGVMCSVIGEACTNNPSDADKNYGKSVFGFMTNLIVIPYANPPASGVAWAYSGLQNAGFVPKTYAAEGIGFAAIKPFSNLWKIFRDLSYMVLVIILIAIGFMIMFRTKINPQTVISVENALPKIVIALILITFSFAIAGFLIDLMYIAIGLIVSILIKDPTQATQFKNEYMMSSAAQLWVRDLQLRNGLTTSGQIGTALIGILPSEVEVTIRTLIGGITALILRGPLDSIIDPISKTLNNWAFGTVSWGEIFGGPIKIILTTFVGLGVFTLGFYYLITPIFILLIFFSILFLLFRIIMMLFSNYLKLILLVVLGPFLLLFEAVPGKSALKYWVMNIIGNLLAFPLTIFIFCLGYVLLNSNPQIDFTARLPYLYGINSDNFRLLISTGLVFLIPDLNKLAKEALGIKDLPIPIGVGTYFGGVAAGVGGGVGLLGQIGSVSLGLQALSGEGGIAKFFQGAKARLKGSVTNAAQGGATGP
jgi:hypothetical protein